MIKNNEKYGFVYIWRDKRYNRYYIGSHWGHEYDRYICSSHNMSEAYRRRPLDFKRRILSRIITNQQELLHEEQRWLDKIPRDQFGQKYYNKNAKVQGYWWTNEEVKKDISKKISQATKEAMNRNDVKERFQQGLKTRKNSSCPEETKRKRSISMKLRWQDPSYVEKVTNGVIKAVNTPEEKARRSMLMQKLSQDKTYINKLSEASKRNWQNEEYRNNVASGYRKAIEKLKELRE